MHFEEFNVQEGEEDEEEEEQDGHVGSADSCHAGGAGRGNWAKREAPGQHMMVKEWELNEKVVVDTVARWNCWSTWRSQTQWCRSLSPGSQSSKDLQKRLEVFSSSFRTIFQF